MNDSLNILMLEDSVIDAELIQRLILKQKPNCRFRLAIDEDTYRQALDEFHPHIILSDHSLPAFNSANALHIARQRFPEIPFIMVTGTVSEEFAANIIKSGADDYILKDRLARLPDAIINSIQRRNSEKEKQDTAQKIIQSETNFRAIFENTSEGFVLMDRDAVVIAFNNKAVEYTGFSKVSKFKIGQSIYNYIEESRKDFFKKIIEKVLKGESVHYDRSYEMKNGNPGWIDFSLTPVREAGQVKGICMTGRDVTEKKIIEQEREFDRNNLKALINNTNDLLWSVDIEFKLITSNEAFNKMVKEMLGKTVIKGTDILAGGFSKDQSKRFRRYYERAFSGEAFTEIEQLTDGRWSEISYYPIYNGNGIIGAACFSRDISQRKKAEENLRSLENKIQEQKIQEQKKVARAIITGQEKERNYIGQELHDNINQLLASVKMFLGLAGKKNAEVKELVKYPIELIDSSIEEIRLLCHKLVPPHKNINLEALIWDLLIDLEENTQIKTEFAYSLPGKSLHNDLKLNIYRIIQEQLNNIVKHAGAKKISISVQAENNGINIVMTDDGKGFDTTKKRKGIGFLNMVNRVESFNGEMAIESSENNGCKVSFKIPC